MSFLLAFPMVFSSAALAGAYLSDLNGLCNQKRAKAFLQEVNWAGKLQLRSGTKWRGGIKWEWKPRNGTAG
jgi:hypothetical protein